MKLFFSTLLHFSAFPDLSWDHLGHELFRVQQRSFPELDKAILKLGSFSEADSFFQSNLDPASLLLGQPVYQIQVNPYLLTHPCPPAALEAVLAHELSHTLDYQRGGLAGLSGIGLQLLFDPAPYEHRTDLQAIFRGYGPGLILYRQWVYNQLTPAQVRHKQEIYYTPSQIQLILKRLQTLNFAETVRLQQRWLEHPPLNAEQIQQP